MNKLIEQSVYFMIWICALLYFGAVLGIIGFLAIKGSELLSLSLIFGDVGAIDAILLRKQVFDGLFPAIAGTILLVVLTMSFAIPIGIGAGIYLAEYAEYRIKHMMNIFFDTLAAIPSIVIGLFGLSLIIFLNKYFHSRLYPSLFISSLSLSVLVLPYIIRSTQLAMEGVPQITRLTALSLGATKLQNIFYVLLPKSLSGILSGVLLAIGRCASDVAVIMLTGVVANAGIPGSLLGAYEALPFYIFYIASEYRNQAELMTGYSASLILLIICTILFIISSVMGKSVKRLSLIQ